MLALLLLLVAGLALLVAGAELLVRGAARLATAFGVTPLIVGLTVVAFGTSAPEMAVSVQSALAGQADLALGNVVGSNIFNVLFILGVSALITPLVVSAQVIRLDVPLMVAVSLLLLLLALDGVIARWEGALLFAGILGYTAFLIRLSRRQARAENAAAESGTPDFVPGDNGDSANPRNPGNADDPARRAAATHRTPSRASNVFLVLGGLALLVLGSRWLVSGAVGFATAWGVSELVIGLTIVAAGTSLPEVATSVLASIRGERDIAVGNVVGSNIFNILGVLGLSALLAPAGIAVVPTARTFDIPVMIAVAVACMPILFSGGRIDRWEGALFLACFLAYTTYLVIHAVDHPILPAFRTAMMLFVLPLTALTLLLVAWQRRA